MNPRLLGVLAFAWLLPVVASARGGRTVLAEDANEWREERFCGRPTQFFIQGPKSEGARDGMLAFGADGEVYVACGTFIQRIGKDGTVRILAGTPGLVGNTDGPPWRASFGDACDIALADEKTLYVVDRVNFTVRRLKKMKGGAWHTETVAGVPGKMGHKDGPGKEALFAAPLDSLAVDEKGVVYVMDGNWLRKIENGVVTSLNAGTGRDDGPLAEAGFSRAMGSAGGLAYAGEGILFVADRWNMAIRRVDLKASEVTTYAGRLPGAAKGGPNDGTVFQARFHPGGGPCTIVYNPKEKCLLVKSADEKNIRRIKDGWVKTLAAGGRAVQGSPHGVDPDGNIYIGGGRRLVRTKEGDADE